MPISHRVAVFLQTQFSLFFVSDWREIHGSMGWKHESCAWFEEFVTCTDQGVQHGLAKQEVAHPFANNDIDDLHWFVSFVRNETIFFHWKLNIFDGPLNDCYYILNSVCFHDRFGVFGHIGVLDCINFLRPSLSTPSRQDPRSCSHIHDNFVLEDIGIAHDSRMVSCHSVVIYQHLFLMIQLGITAEIVRKVCCFGFLISIE
mmetsp:Transcript_34860/g.49476  ORF Transcript_34860/g.49476 Transcript_34860/m.49476 type:complete len:202 (+) Transcript_34860:729-1334(+)